MQRAALSALVLVLLPTLGAGEILIEGTVTLPPVKVTAASARYQQRAGTVAAPDAPAAVVYLEGPFAPSLPQTNHVTVQRNFQFFPGLLPILKGTSVEFPNQDDDYHHVFSYSKAKEFDLGRYRKDEKAPSITFDRAGVIKVGCEIHDHMRAIILVLETPHFTKTGADGTYRLALQEPPAGPCVLKVWINERTVWQKPVELKDGARLRADFPGP